ncbi:LacI family DNA-binding transcriptional regulator [Terrabacter sp. MAHUQ-38]|uniref:LacI family DNA-binding transcriptional regulator n=1 Tax=unclassified Terrabacter TaxID=2630222 RepID=UPI00165DA0C8|nr:LacI family DNA-binding transcriptional regulator [Terrabacter sp. MAHUQ-38]MBC9824119.1 LacI family DNA-binding transcriptional regulator [Terrabacter sp. MAHUQ-38]
MTALTGTGAPRAPGLVDVARVAGVSRQTVSRVVNGSGHIRPATRERVRLAIDQLGYRPNTAARALVSGRSGTLGIICASSHLYGPARIRTAVEQACRDSGYVAASFELTATTEAAIAQAVEHLLQVQVEGIVLIAGDEHAVDVNRSRAARVPLVAVEGNISGHLSVGVDQVHGAQLATKHLLSLGHRIVAHVTGPSASPEAQARLRGWRQAMAVLGLRDTNVIEGDWSAASGYRAGLELAETPDVTAVFAANDQMALGLLRALHEAGRCVPHDVSVVGFDDVPEAEYLVVPLTTVRQDFDGVGRAAVDRVTHLLRGSEHTPAAPPLLESALVVRSSTAPPRAGRFMTGRAGRAAPS